MKSREVKIERIVALEEMAAIFKDLAGKMEGSESSATTGLEDLSLQTGSFDRMKVSLKRKDGQFELKLSVKVEAQQVPEKEL